ncbi:DDE_3 domain-containing protein [Trichonephila clavipes]|nr:DDE_3 domain-containing protein [Trichonephila clavipes]
MILIVSYQLSSIEVELSLYGLSCRGFSARPIVTVKRWTTGSKYKDILAVQVHPMVQTLFPAGNGIVQDDNAPIQAARLVQSWFEEHEDQERKYLFPIKTEDGGNCLPEGCFAASDLSNPVPGHSVNRKRNGQTQGLVRINPQHLQSCRLPKWEAKTRHEVSFVLALLKILEEDLTQQHIFQDRRKEALSDLSLEIELVIPFSPNQEPQDIPQPLQLGEFMHYHPSE